MDSQEAKLSITIAHAAHAPERKATLGRMLEKLPSYTVVDTTPGKPHEWSLAQWKRGLEGEPTHCVYLNDDLILCDGFEETILNILKVLPDNIINLYNTHNLSAEAYTNGYRWTTSPDGLIGNAYVLPANAVRILLDWRETALLDGVTEAISEDQLLNLWAMSRRAYIWHTVPALVDHDTTVSSLFGNVQLRRPCVGPKPDMPSLNWKTDAIHTGRTFTGNHWGLIKCLKPGLRDIQHAYELHRDVSPI